MTAGEDAKEDKEVKVAKPPAKETLVVTEVAESKEGKKVSLLGAASGGMARRPASDGDLSDGGGDGAECLAGAMGGLRAVAPGTSRVWIPASSRSVSTPGIRRFISRLRANEAARSRALATLSLADSWFSLIVEAFSA